LGFDKPLILLFVFQAIRMRFGIVRTKKGEPLDEDPPLERTVKFRYADTSSNKEIRGSVSNNFTNVTFSTGKRLANCVNAKDIVSHAENRNEIPFFSVSGNRRAAVKKLVTNVCHSRKVNRFVRTVHSILLDIILRILSHGKFIIRHLVRRKEPDIRQFSQLLNPPIVELAFELFKVNIFL
jgi:hypothetical protein